ncbi:MAG: biotin--[acetyl-CoA-carboxylase] ligase [Bacteroidetes bacterium QH_8_67_23]|nr:MAG: biotin--[acetyl-CoA-carboxylase] ligase [Bacteroidetes bacterium QH_8_67_23]
MTSSTSASASALARAAQEHLRTRRLGRPMEGHARLGSTNERALAWAAHGAPEGAVVTAEHQTAGRGRHGRRWRAKPGQNLTFSVVLHPAAPSTDRQALSPARFGLLGLAGGLAVCEAVAETVAPPAPALKWPNDVLVDGNKCCGLLLETASAADHAPGPVVVLGVGLNVNQRAFPGVTSEREPHRAPPTSLARVAGRPVERAPLLAQILRRLEARYQSLFDDAGRSVRAACEARLTALGERVTVERPRSGERLDGVFLGLAPDGAMRLRLPGGAEHVLHAGDVTTIGA